MEVSLREKAAFRNLSKMVILKTVFIGCYVYELGFEFLSGKTPKDLMDFQNGSSRVDSEREMRIVEDELRKIVKFVN